MDIVLGYVDVTSREGNSCSHEGTMQLALQSAVCRTNVEDRGACTVHCAGVDACVRPHT